MTIGGWELAALACKWLLLLAMAGIIGGSFAAALATRLQVSLPTGLLRYLLACAVVGITVTPLMLLLQVGAINQNGVAGMFDPVMAGILLQSGLGQALLLRCAAFALALIAVAWWWSAERQRAAGRIIVALGVTATAFAASFALTGHVSTLQVPARMLIAAHVAAAMLWTGALYPLLQLSRGSDVAGVSRILRGFGRLATVIVAVLLVSGLLLANSLVSGLPALWRTPYGISLLVKLAGVAGLLLLAATNKWWLVPRLAGGATMISLRHSIRLEIVIALYVLAVTVWLTTTTGPAGH